MQLWSHVYRATLLIISSLVYFIKRNQQSIFSPFALWSSHFHSACSPTTSRNVWRKNKRARDGNGGWTTQTGGVLLLLPSSSCSSIFLLWNITENWIEGVVVEFFIFKLFLSSFSERENRFQLRSVCWTPALSESKYWSSFMSIMIGTCCPHRARFPSCFLLLERNVRVEKLALRKVTQWKRRRRRRRVLNDDSYLNETLHFNLNKWIIHKRHQSVLFDRLREIGKRWLNKRRLTFSCRPLKNQ